MDTTEAEDWAFTFVANAIRDRIGYAEQSLDTIAYTLFDHDLEAATGNRLHLTAPRDRTPAIFIEKLGEDEYDIVIAWEDVEVHRSELQDELLLEVRKFLP